MSAQRLSPFAFRLLVGVAAAALIIGATALSARRADRHLRADLLLQARLVARTVDPEEMSALTGTEADLASPGYGRIKKQLAVIRSANPNCRFVYFMGRTLQDQIIFFADSEPADSVDYSPPGQTYDEASDELRQTFAAGLETVEGPFIDRWGAWVSAFIPLPDLRFEGAPILLGMDIEARDWNQIVALRAALPATLAAIAVLLGLLASSLYRSRRTLRARQAELQESESRFVQLAEHSRTIVWETDAQGLYTYVSPAVEPVLGYRPDELVGIKHFYDLHPEEGREAFKHSALQTFERKEPFENFENAATAKDGKPLWILTNGIPLLNADGTLRGYRGSDIDITERKRAEGQVRALLAESNQSRQALLGILEDQTRAEAGRQRLATAIEQADETIVITDATGLIEYVNPAFERVTGYTRAEALGQNPRILQSGRHDAAFYHALWETLVIGQTWRGRLINRRKGGSIYTEDAVISPVLDEARHITHFVAVKRDITEHMRLSEQFQQSQKMDAIGRLAGGVAHDFNNMLTVILGHAQMALDEADLAAPLRARLDEIHKAATRSADLTRQLLAFARKQTIAPRMLNLNKMVEGSLNMLRRLIGEDIHLKWIPRDPPNTVEMDPGQIDQILANLCINARDAITGGGTVTIETGTAICDAAYCEEHPAARPGEYARLTVCDTGCGMDADTLSKVFEPFFTTKELGQGTGLGLSTVYGIVQQNNGFIEVESAPGEGAAFHVYLPRREAAENAPTVEPPPPRGTETILVAEDEPAMLATTVQMLESAGYTVLSAQTPTAAIQTAHTNPGAIQLLLTDVVMPGLNGWMLSREILREQPGIRCLFMSGYTADVIAQNGVLEKGVDFIQKPFSKRILTEKVRAVLDG